MSENKTRRQEIQQEIYEWGEIERTDNQRAASMIFRFRTLAKSARERSVCPAYKPKAREYERGYAVGLETAIEMMERTF